MFKNVHQTILMLFLINKYLWFLMVTLQRVESLPWDNKTKMGKRIYPKAFIIQGDSSYRDIDIITSHRYHTKRVWNHRIFLNLTCLWFDLETFIKTENKTKKIVVCPFNFYTSGGFRWGGGRGGGEQQAPPKIWSTMFFCIPFCIKVLYKHKAWELPRRALDLAVWDFALRARDWKLK